MPISSPNVVRYITFTHVLQAFALLKIGQSAAYKLHESQWLTVHIE